MSLYKNTIDCPNGASKLNSIKPLAAEFGGTLYRSRTEARWAIFFSELGILANYEEEAFEIPDGNGGTIRYMPDFHIRHQDKFPSDIYFEVKPSGMGGVLLNEYDSRKISAFSNYKTIGILGSMSRGVNDLHGGYGGFEICGPGIGDCGFLFCQCMFCGAFGFEFNGRSERIKCCSSDSGHKEYNSDAPEIMNAIDVASSYRFWK